MSAVLGYRIPSSQYYTISGEFSHVGGWSGGVTVYLKENNSQIWTKTLTMANGVFSFTRYFDANEYIYFGVSAGSADYYDSTMLKGSIAAIPEPMSVSLLGLGVLGVFGLKRKKA